MKKFWLFIVLFVMNACTTEYVLMEDSEYVENDGYSYYTSEPNPENMSVSNAQSEVDVYYTERDISANDVFPIEEGADFVTYQYKSVRVDEISPLASLYCDDVALGASPYLREVSIYHNGFMRATFDCVNLAI